MAGAKPINHTGFTENGDWRSVVGLGLIGNQVIHPKYGKPEFRNNREWIRHPNLFGVRGYYQHRHPSGAPGNRYRNDEWVYIQAHNQRKDADQNGPAHQPHPLVPPYRHVPYSTLGYRENYGNVGNHGGYPGDDGQDDGGDDDDDGHDDGGGGGGGSRIIRTGGAASRDHRGDRAARSAESATSTSTSTSTSRHRNNRDAQLTATPSALSNSLPDSSFSLNSLSGWSALGNGNSIPSIRSSVLNSPNSNSLSLHSISTFGQEHRRRERQAREFGDGLRSILSRSTNSRKRRSN
jgi:hypothetical protein